MSNPIPSPVLLERERKYVLNHYIKGMPKYRAYREAGYSANTHGTAWSGARQLESRKRVKAYIEVIREMLAAKENHERENDVLQFDEKRQFLAKVVRTPVSEVDEYSPLASEVKHDNQGNRTVKMPDKLKALELDSRLVGDFKDTLTVKLSDRTIELADGIDI